MTVLADTLLSWRGLTVAGLPGKGTPFTLRTLDGWDGWEATESRGRDRQGAHGTFDEPAYVPKRVVTATGRVLAPVNRDALWEDLAAQMYPSGPQTEPLTVTHAGRTLTAEARLVRFAPVATVWGAGEFSWAAQWTCPDPLRYGAPVSVSAGFPAPGGGLEYDLYTDGAGTDLGYLDYGAASDTGRMVLTNTGTAPAPVLFQIDGAVAAQGFEIAQVDGPGRLRFAGPNSATSTLVLDGATGNVLVDGDSDRGGLLTWRDWPVIPAATRVAGVLVPGSIEVAFIPLGASSSARLTAVVRPGSW